MKIQNILVPTDFSDDARSALDAAVDWAAEFGATIHIVHAYFVDVPAVDGGYGGDFLLPADILEPVREAAETSVAELVAEASQRGVSAEGRATLGDASSSILAEAERLGADLIVMGTRGLTGLKHVILGSTAERVVRKSPCPVLTVKANA